MNYTPEQRDFLDHVQDRMGSVYHQVSLRTHFDLDEEILVFYLWNLSGQIKGILEYSWKGHKLGNNLRGGRYHVVSVGQPCLYGIEFINTKLPYTFICEGVFDAISLMRYGNAVAVLSNQATHLEEQLKLLPGIKVAVCDGDKAGCDLIKYADKFVVCPDGQDPNSLTTGDLKLVLGDYAIERDFYQDTFLTWWEREGLFQEEGL